MKKKIKQPIRKAKERKIPVLAENFEEEPKIDIESEESEIQKKIREHSVFKENKEYSQKQIEPTKKKEMPIKEETKKSKKELPQKEKEKLEKRLAEEEGKEKRAIKQKIINTTFTIVFALILGFLVYITTKSLIGALVFTLLAAVLLLFSTVIRKKLEEAEKIKKMESVFPDFIELVSSNLRAGMTVEKAILYSSRKEFSPLDKEILQLGKDIATGKDFNIALRALGERINSDKIKKTLNLIISGVKSGGNMSVLLNETAVYMREREFVEKKAAANILMYNIFIIFSITVGAPILFALSSILVQIMSTILANVSVPQGAISLPFTLTKLNISPNFVIYFTLVFLIVIDILASFVLGIVSKGGEEKAGIRYMLPITSASLIIFFLTRLVLSRYFANFFG